MPRTLFLLGISGVLTAAAVVASCSASDEGGASFQADGEDQGSGGAGVGGGGNPSGGGFNPTTSGSASSGGMDCVTDPSTDDDMDGFTEPEDCNDCDANVNPGAVEVVVTEPVGDGGIPEPADEDCDGTADNPLPTCDDGIAVDDADPNNGAKAIDLCKEATGDSWGILSAEYVRADGTAMPANEAVGIFDNFGSGVSVQVGQRMLGLSSGHARIPGQPGVCANHMCGTVGAGTPPPNYPQDVPGCELSDIINDDAGLEVRLRAPTNATGYRFLFKFYSFEFAEYVCTFFNDQFVALVDPPPNGANNGNISFDMNGNPVSVNIAFFDVCDAATNNDFAIYCFSGTCPVAPNPYCPAGPGELQGNGYLDAYGSGAEDGGGTSWLQTTAPIGGGEEFSIRFAIWDVQDTIYDSTTIIDGFEWIASGGTVNVGTGEIPDPK